MLRWASTCCLSLQQKRVKGALMATAEKVIEAEKGKNLSPQNLHLRLRVVEWVLLVSLLLNIAHWIVGGAKDHSLQNQVNHVEAQR